MAWQISSIVFSWSLNGFILPDQPDDWLKIAKLLTSELAIDLATFCYNYYVELNVASVDTISGNPLPIRSYPPPLTLHPYGSACGIDYTGKKRKKQSRCFDRL